MFPEVIDVQSLAQLLPMSLQLSADGAVVHAGATVRRMIGSRQRFEEIFTIERPKNVIDGYSGLGPSLERGERLVLRLISHPETVLRGHGVRLGSGGAVLNLGFGIGLPDAVRTFKLTDADFSPSELAMELLFLHEANSAVQGELARFNLHLEEAKKAAEVQAYTDPLTGLYNRRGLGVALSSALREADRLPFAVAHIDLDLFKTVNDTYGHAAGDYTLQRVAKILREETRSCDTAARVGGDEFVLILPTPGAPEVLIKLSRRIIARIEETMTFDGNLFQVSASIGLAESVLYDEPTSDVMLADADSALYFAKKTGRGRAEIYGRKNDGWSLS